MTSAPDRGDIIVVNMDPSAGSEIQKRRPALVISHKQFNAATGFAFIVPITSTHRGLNIEVHVEGSSTQGYAITQQTRSLDYRSRDAEVIDRVSDDELEQVVKRVRLFIS